MKKIAFLFTTILIYCNIQAQQAENVVIITFDGLRWQELFAGMDSALANNKAFNQNQKAYIYKTYDAPSEEERRKKLMPFMWSVIESQGRIFGNRKLGNKVDNANPFWFSYPGYSEIFCGYADTAVNSNNYPPNPNTNVLEYIHRQEGFAGKVAAFGAWDAFDRILNEARAGFPVVCGSENTGGANPSPREQLLNQMKRDAYSPFGDAERLDVFTHYAAMEYLQAKRPRVLYISYGETDEWAHHGHYRDYLDAARQTDKWIQDIWNWLQADPAYKDKTTMFITTDHGRGDKIKAQWTSHGKQIADSHEMWFAAIGAGIAPGGEMKKNTQLYQKQIAQTVAESLGLRFEAKHPVAEGLGKELGKK